MEGADVFPDDVVRVIDDMAEVHRLQKDGPGWDDDMVLVGLNSKCLNHSIPATIFSLTHSLWVSWDVWRGS